MAKITSDPISLVFDGRGYGLINCIVVHRPSLLAASISIYGIDANGDKVTLASAHALKTALLESEIVVDVIPIMQDPLTVIWYEIDNSENMIELPSVQFTSALPAEVEAN